MIAQKKENCQIIFAIRGKNGEKAAQKQLFPNNINSFAFSIMTFSFSFSKNLLQGAIMPLNALRNLMPSKNVNHPCIMQL